MRSLQKKFSLRKVVITLLSAVFMASGCGLLLVGNNNKVNAADTSLYYTVDTTTKKQTFDGWGTSLCWWADQTGGWDMEGASGRTKREELADLFFSEDALNLNIVRYNIPAGDDPSHNHMKDGRNMAGFKTEENGEYQWDNGANQFWMLNSAYEKRQNAGDFYLEAFSNAAPYWMTNTGCSSGGEVLAKNEKNEPTSVGENLSASMFGDFASYFADVVEYIETEMNIPVSSVEILNEPGSDYWYVQGKQEGNKVTQGEHQSQLILALYDEMQNRGMLDEDTIIAGCDETNPALAYQGYNALSNEAKNALSKINYHIYSHSDTDRRNIGSLASSKKVWMSEICYGIAENDEDGDSHTTLTNTFSMASDIYKDIYLANSSAWVIWQAMESDLENRTYLLNYGLLHGVYQDKDQADYAIDMDANAINRGDYYITKQYYTLGQYSKYIKAGYSILPSPVENCVVAISPNNDEVVLVYSNDSDEEREINYYLKGFNGTAGKTIVTDATNNWKESQIDVNGSYATFTSKPKSITTVVVSGNKIGSYATSGTFFKKFVNQGTSLYGEVKLPSVTDGSVYDLYYSTSALNLPINGGTTASSTRLSASSVDATFTVAKPTSTDKYYAVIKRSLGGEAYYTNVLSTEVIERDNSFTYLTLAGKENKFSLTGTNLTFGQYYGVADQAFGEDPFSGKKWGYVTSNTGEYTGDEVFGSLRYSNENELTYKYQVEGGVNYSVMLGFYDLWGQVGRNMSLYINGVDTNKYVEDTFKVVCLSADNVQGVQEGSEYYITVTLKLRAGTQKPTVNLIAIQTQSQPQVVFDCLDLTRTIPQGLKVEDNLPTQIDLITSKGLVKTSNVEYANIDYTSALNTTGGQIIAHGVAENKYDFTVTFATTSSTSQIYYYIDSGALNPSANSIDEFNVIKQSNTTLVNTDKLDKYSAGDNDWGRVGATSDYGNHWENDDNKMSSIIEGKYKPSGGDGVSKHIQYRLTNLPAGNYEVVVGCNLHGWGSQWRDLTISIGGTTLGTKTGYTDVNEWVFNYNKTNSDTVIFDMASSGGTDPYGAIMSYLIIRTATVGAEPPANLTIKLGAGTTGTNITVGNFVKDALIAVTASRMDENTGSINEYLVAEHIATQSDVDNRTYTFENVNIGRAYSLTARQVVLGTPSNAVTVNTPIINASAPRIEWKQTADTITINPISNRIDKILYKYSTDSKWIDIKDTKYFRATKNGEYLVKIVTLDNNEVVEKIMVTHIDSVVMTTVTDLTKWVDTDMLLEINFLKSANNMQKVEVSDGTTVQDVTGTYKDGVFKYYAKENGSYTVTATSIYGAVETFEIVVGTIDRQEVSLDYELSNDKGNFVVNLTTESLGDVTYALSKDGGEFKQVYQTKQALVESGKYEFRITNMVGKSKTVKIDYNAENSKDAGIFVTQTSEAEGESVYQITADGSIQNLMVKKLAGDGNEIEVENGTFAVNEGGEYIVYGVRTDGEIVVTKIQTKVLNTSTGVYDNSGDLLGLHRLTQISTCIAIALVGAVAVIKVMERRKNND